MASHSSNLCSSNMRQQAEVHSLRKVTSMNALHRGRSSLPRNAEGSAAVASKSSRASSLGRYRTKTTRYDDHERPLKSRRTTLNRRDCEYRRSTASPNDDETGETRAWAVGRLSMMFLLIVTFTDTAFKIVNNQMSQIEAHDYYDALSPDVIRPAFLYKTAMTIERPSLGLGSAAISSITDALGPILPFTGGVDLRRSEYYESGNLLKNLRGLVQQTYQAYADAKEDNYVVTESVVSKTTTHSKQASKKEKKKHTLTLGASEPFVSLDKIAQLTLEDVGTVFDYATKRTVQGFNPAKYQNGVLPRVKTVIHAMEKAVSKSRGMDIVPVPVKDTSSGSMDAFMFCAVMRVFAEWRILRQVPDGYKGYAVGMSLGQKDVVQNVAKMERAAQSWIDQQLESAASATLRDVLQYEIDIGEHPTLPRLKESSGGMGLLWVRRQLHYQTVIFENLLEVPTKYSSAKEAVSAAYTTVYGSYHGWAVQKVFSYSFQASPPVEVIYKYMNPHKLAEVIEIASSMESSSKSLDEEDSTNEGDTTEEEPSKTWDVPPENPLHRIGWEWEKFVDGVGQNLGKLLPKGKKPSKESGEGLMGPELEEFVCEEMAKNVHDHVVSYLDVVTPLLGDLAELFDELNMDDPTKV